MLQETSKPAQILKIARVFVYQGVTLDALGRQTCFEGNRKVCDFWSTKTDERAGR
jgi:hypothetical protein